MRKPDEVPDWDAACIVIRAAADGRGPPNGARVACFGVKKGLGHNSAPVTSRSSAFCPTASISESSPRCPPRSPSPRPGSRQTSSRDRRLRRRGSIRGATSQLAGAHVVAVLEGGDGFTGTGADEIVARTEDAAGAIFWRSRYRWRPRSLGGTLPRHARWCAPEYRPSLEGAEHD